MVGLYLIVVLHDVLTLTTPHGLQLSTMGRKQLEMMCLMRSSLIDSNRHPRDPLRIFQCNFQGAPDSSCRLSRVQALPQTQRIHGISTTSVGRASIFPLYQCTRLVSSPSLVNIPVLHRRVSSARTWQVQWPLLTHSNATPPSRNSFDCYHAGSMSKDNVLQVLACLLSGVFLHFACRYSASHLHILIEGSD